MSCHPNRSQAMVLCLAMLSACGQQKGRDALIEEWRLHLAEQSVPWGVVDCGAAMALWSGRTDTLHFVDPSARVISARHVLGWAPLAVGCASDDVVIALGAEWIARVRVDGSSVAPQVGHALAAQYRPITAEVDGEGIRVVAIDSGGRAVLVRQSAEEAAPSRIPFSRGSAWRRRMRFRSQRRRHILSFLSDAGRLTFGGSTAQAECEYPQRSPMMQRSTAC